jgi:hypothetical protein
MVSVAMALVEQPMDGEEREERFAAVAGRLNAVHAELAELVAGVSETELAAGGYRSLSQLLCHRTGMSPGRARALVRTVDRRGKLPVCWSAFRDGLISVDQMEAIARWVPAHLDVEAREQARSMSPAQLTRAFRHAPRPEPEAGPTPDAGERRGATAHWDDDGDLVVRARLGPLDGAQVDAALGAHGDALFEEWKAAKRRAEADGLAFTEPMPTISDALVRMAERSLAAEAASRPHHRRLTAWIHVDVDAPSASVHLGPALSPALRREATCDATYRVVYERDGIPVGVGRTSRAIPRRTRALVEERDGGCRVPGCAGRHVQIHHVVHWEDGGPTDTANLMALCPAHHRAHHQGRLGIEGDDADDPEAIVFTRADGRPMPTLVPPRPPGDGPPPPAGPYPGVDGGRADLRWLAFPLPPGG